MNITDSTAPAQTIANTEKIEVITTIEVKPLIAEYTEKATPVSTRDLAIFFHKLDAVIQKHEDVEKAKYHPVAGRYFKVDVQHERNESWLHRGKKEALQDVVTSLKRQFTLEQRVTLEQAAGSLRKELFDLENNKETDQRIRRILADEAI